MRAISALVSSPFVRLGFVGWVFLVFVCGGGPVAAESVPVVAAVGRAPKVNTPTLGDRALSGQHFKIVPHDGTFVAVDLEATNGTLVNGRRIRAQRLESGDSIRAGEIEFEFKTILKPLG